MTLFLILSLAFFYLMGILLMLIYVLEALTPADRAEQRVQNFFAIALWPFAVLYAVGSGLVERGWDEFKWWKYNRARKAEDKRRDEFQRSRT